jgi:L-iditol 2-dehydrogenase
LKAAVLEGIERLSVRDLPDPVCDPGSIIVRVEACGICGSDIRSFHHGLRTGVTGQVMGHEIAGSVTAVGSGVAGFTVGENVAIAPDVSCGSCWYCARGWVNLCERHRMIGTHWPGGFAQYVHLPADVLARGMVHPMPRGLAFEQGALAEPAASVLAAQERAGVGPGDQVAVIGDGPIGCLHIDVARSRGAGRLFMAGMKRLALAAAFAPDALIDAGGEDTVAAIRRLTEGRGADVVIVAAPDARAQAQAVEAVRKRGTVVLFGGLPAGSPMASLNTNAIHYNEIRVIGAFSYPASAHKAALAMIAEGGLDARKYFTSQVSLEGIGDGIRAAEAGAALKVLVRPWA